MTANREHVVPLTRPAMRIIERCAELRMRDCPFVFPAMRRGQPLSDMTLTKVLKVMKEPYTAHGFRSSFRDWASEETSHASDIAEAALAHSIANKTEAAYRRGNLLEKRRILMQDWADWCEGRTATEAPTAGGRT